MVSRNFQRLIPLLDATITNIVDGVRQYAHPLTGAAQDYDPLLNLIGEASYCTHEFYQQRAEITKRLIQEQGFTA